MKPVCIVCAIAKLENNYVREWVEHYLSLGFDKVVLYDNNDEDNEYLATPIQDFINNGYVDLINARGKKSYQLEAYNDCYVKYSDVADWVLFVDLDEFLFFENVATIQEFISKNKTFDNYNVIAFRWRLYNDNNLVGITDNNFSVLNRFTTPSSHKTENTLFKELIRTNIQDLKINSVHVVKEGYSIGESEILIFNSKEAIQNVHICDCDGNKIDFHHVDAFEPFSCAYIKHFRYKTIQEYLDSKIQRGYPMPFRDYGTTLGLFDFFNSNGVTPEKLAFIKDWLTKTNISDTKKQSLVEELNKIIKWGYKGRP